MSGAYTRNLCAQTSVPLPGAYVYLGEPLLNHNMINVHLVHLLSPDVSVPRRNPEQRNVVNFCVDGTCWGGE